MTVVEWSDDYLLNVATMDDQHRRWFILIAEFRELAGREASAEQVLAKFDEMVAFSVEHFDAEEKLMRDVSFPEYERHKPIHEAFLQQLQGHRLRLADPQSNGAAFIATVIENWVRTHVAVVDRQYAPFLSEG